MQIICVFPSGRMIDRTTVPLDKIQKYAEEFPTLNYFFI